jgi:PAS domain-containing protein
MSNPPKQHTARKLYTLRQRAETILAKRSQEQVDMPVAASQRLMHELHLHQVEPETQNEELCLVQAELAAAHDRYADLYDFVPVGYLNLDTVGVILEANLTAEQLLAVPRAYMIGRRLIKWVAPEAHHTLYCHWQ